MEANTTITAHGAVQTKAAGASVSGAAKDSVTAKAGVLHAGNTAKVSAGTSAKAGASSAAGSAGSGHASFFGALKTSLGAHVGGMAKTGAVVLKTSLTAKALVAVGVGVAGLVVAAHTGDVAGAQAAVTAVPTWTSGPTILGHMQTVVGGGGSGGAGIHLIL